MNHVTEIGPPLTVAERVLVLERLAENLGVLVSDHEKRLRWIERVVLYGMGVLGLGSFVYQHLRP